MDTYTLATELIETTITEYGAGSLSCDACDWNTYIDRDALDNSGDTDNVAELIEHTRFDHGAGGNILFTRPVIVLKTRDHL